MKGCQLYKGVWRQLQASMNPWRDQKFRLTLSEHHFHASLLLKSRYNHKILVTIPVGSGFQSCSQKGRVRYSVRCDPSDRSVSSISRVCSLALFEVRV